MSEYIRENRLPLNAEGEMEGGLNAVKIDEQTL